MMKFNIEQKKAINTDINKNVLVSASAGSGKTQILSYKVYKTLIDDNGIEPNNILVLTFTNKAAYEMKERIIRTIRENDPDNTKLINELVSAKIMTFDAFSMNLVKSYSSYLKIPSNLSIISSNEVNLLFRKYLDEVIDRLVTNNDILFFELVKKFDSFKFNKTKEVIFSIYNKIKNLNDEEKKQLLNNIDNYYDEKTIFTLRGQFIEEYVKNNFLYPIVLFTYVNDYSYLDDVPFKDFVDNFNDNFYPLGNKPLEKLIKHCKQVVFKGISISDEPADSTSPDTDINKANRFVDQTIMFLETILPKDGEDKTSFYLMNNFSSLPDKLYVDTKGKEITGKINGLDYLKEIFNIPNGIQDLEKKYEYIYNLINNKEQINNIYSTKDAIKKIISIIEEIEKRIDEYKKKNNVYEYKDIFNTALKLFEFKEIRESIQNQYKFIVVDEYQDTNVEQETFINYLAKNGHLFLVGDAKQSIYRFRNSEVKLFIDRRDKFNKDKNSEVISMNYNYRSLKKVIDDINLIFSKYMTIYKGGVNYDNQDEKLRYDNSANIYDTSKLNIDRNEHGIKILKYETSSNDTESESNKECKLIIKDIIDKVNNKYQVTYLDKNGKLLNRDCTYSDFAILVRKKRNFANYLSLFNKFNVPLINQIDVDLKDTDVFLVIKSILCLLATRLKLIQGGQLHYFVSIARSYLYGNNSIYTDNEILRIAKEYNNKNYELFNNTEIIQKIDNIAKLYSSVNITTIIYEIINQFHLIDKLKLIGELDDNVEKIYTLFNGLIDSANNGLSLVDFINKIDDYNKYDISFSHEVESNNSNAVKLITLHGSKGLEFPIVYLPSSDNKVEAKHNDMDSISTIVSLQEGILVPNYLPNYMNDTSYYSGGGINQITKSFLFDKYKLQNSDEIENSSENARLYYVLFTRAKESIYIVGNEPNIKGKEESLFSLLKFTKHTYHLDELFITNKTSEPKEEVDKMISEYKHITSILSDIEQNRNIYKVNPDFNLEHLYLLNIYIDFLNKIFKAKKSNIENQIYKQIYEYYVTELEYNNYPIEKLIEDDNNFTKLVSIVGAIKRDKKSVFDLLQNIKNKYKIKYNKLVELLMNIYNSYIKDKLFYVTFDDFSEKTISIDELVNNNKQSLKEINNVDDKEIRVSNTNSSDKSHIYFKKKIKNRASKQKTKVEDEDALSYVLELGTNIHRILEIVDFKTKDLSFIKNTKFAQYENKIKSFLNLDILKDLNNATVYKEYEFYDKDNLSKGSIDCLIVYDNKAIIIDYKLKNIDDKEYNKQLEYYKKNIKRIFNIKNIECYLYSILDSKLQKVNV